MRARFLLAAGLLVAALLAGVIAGHSAPSASGARAHAQAALRGETGNEGENEARELEEPADALLARELFGADKNIDAGAYYANALAQAGTLTAQTQSVDPAAAKAPWQLVGPTSVGGRVLD